MKFLKKFFSRRTAFLFTDTPWTEDDEAKWLAFLNTSTGIRLKNIAEQTAIGLKLQAATRRDLMKCAEACGYHDAVDFIFYNLTANARLRERESTPAELQGALQGLSKPIPEPGETRNTL